MTQHNRETLLALADRAEKATGPDREIDCFVWMALNGIEPSMQGDMLVAGKEGVIGWIDPGECQRNFTTNRSTSGPAGIPAYTASLDAAMSLVTEGRKGLGRRC